MTELPNVSPLPIPRRLPVVPDRAALISAFQGLAPGWYTSFMLLPRYNAWAEAEGHPVVTTKTLGESIRRMLQLEQTQVHGHVSAWQIPEGLA